MGARIGGQHTVGRAQADGPQMLALRDQALEDTVDRDLVPILEHIDNLDGNGLTDSLPGKARLIIARIAQAKHNIGHDD